MIAIAARKPIVDTLIGTISINNSQTAVGKIDVLAGEIHISLASVNGAIFLLHKSPCSVPSI
jgi:hypothetical protein